MIADNRAGKAGRPRNWGAIIVVAVAVVIGLGLFARAFASV